MTISNGIPEDRPTSEGRGSSLQAMPSLPQTRVSRDKENSARSPGRKTSTKRTSQLRRHHPQQEGEAATTFSSSSSAHTILNKSKFQSSLPMISKRGHESRETDRKVLVPLPFSQNGARKSSSGVEGLDESKHHHKPSIPLPASRSKLESRNNNGVASSRSISRKVLRYRETLEGLFCVTADSSEEYRQLCSDIVDGHLADDAASWCRVLEIANSTYNDRHKNDKASGTYIISDSDMVA